MSLLVYLDEAGDHSLEMVDKDFPLFALVMFICDEDIYTQKIAPMVNRFKIDFFGHEAVILHSRDIRKALKEFVFLMRPDKRQEFYARLNQIMREMDYTLIASVIHKQEHKEKYGVVAANPYDLSLTFVLERLLPLLEEKGQAQVTIIAESRGKNEDGELMLSFLKIVNEGTGYVSAERFKTINFRLRFAPKMMNLVGMQLADLAAYPIARYVHNPKAPNPSYDIIKEKFYKGKGLIRGLKIFP